MKKNSSEKSTILFKIILSLLCGAMVGFFWGFITVLVAKNVFDKTLEFWSMFRWVGAIFFVMVFISLLIKDTRKSNQKQ